MPSASSKSSQPPSQITTSDLMQEPLKNAVSVLDKKLRNLEKRKVSSETYYTSVAFLLHDSKFSLFIIICLLWVGRVDTNLYLGG